MYYPYTYASSGISLSLVRYILLGHNVYPFYNIKILQRNLLIYRELYQR